MKDFNSSYSHNGYTPWNTTNLSAYAPFANTFNFVEGLKDPTVCPNNSLIEVINQVKEPLEFYNRLTADQKIIYIKQIEELGPQKCPEPLFHTVLFDAVNPTQFYAAFTAEQKAEYIKTIENLSLIYCPRDLVVTVIEAAENTEALYRTLFDEEVKKDVFKKLSQKIQLKIIESQAEDVSIFNTLSLDEKKSLFPKLSLNVQIEIFYQWHTRTDVNNESIVLFCSLGSSNKDSLLNSLKKIKEET